MINRIIRFSFIAAAVLLAASCEMKEPEATSLSLSEPSLQVTKLGVTEHNGVPYVTVVSNTYWMAFMAEEYDWLEMSPKGSAAGTADVSFKVQPNVDGEPRQAEIRFETADGTASALVLMQAGRGSDVTVISDNYGEALSNDIEVRYAKQTWDGTGTGDFAYSGELAYISGNEPSSGYEGASGGANIVVKAGGHVVFNRIGAGFSNQFRLSWGYWSEDGPVDFGLYSSADAVSWEKIPYTVSGDGQWQLARTKLFLGGSSEYRYFKFVNNSSSDRRIDDFRMTDAEFTTDDFTVVSAALPDAAAKWNDGEKIAVFSGNEAICFGWCGEGNDFKSIYSLMPASDYIALYPYSPDASYRDGVLSFEVSGRQEYGDNGYNVNMPMTATAGELSGFRFSDLMGTLRVRAKGEAVINSFTFISGDKAVCGRAAVSGGVLSFPEDGGREVTLEITGGKEMTADGQDNTVDIVLPAGTYGRYVIKTVDQSGASTEYPMENLSVYAGKASEVEIDVNPSTVISLNLPSYYGEEGSDNVYANCYRISAPGEYMFIAADAKGEPVKGSDVAWVWATSGVWNGLPEAVLSSLVGDIKYADGCVRFTVPEDFTPGNVILAVVDGSGAIQYSWHIWTTVEPSDVASCGNDWMDRNIGASYAFDPVNDSEHCKAAMGFYYHWGCKNPIVGLYDSSAANNDTFTMGKAATFYIYNPEVMNTGVWGVLSPYPSDWSSSFADLMRYPMSMFPDNTKTPASGSGKNWPEETNPCPYGYCVPSREQMSSLGTSGATIISEDAELKKNVAVERSGVVFPSCGYRKATGAVAISANPDMRYWVDASYSATGRYYWLANKSNNKEMYAGMETGMNLRCVKIKK